MKGMMRGTDGRHLGGVRRGPVAAGGPTGQTCALRGIAGALCAAAALLALAACTTARPRVDVYLSKSAGDLQRPLEVHLRKVAIVSNEIPLAAGDPLVVDFLAAVASRYGFVLSTERRNQPYAMELELREQSLAIDLATRSSLLAVLSIISSADGSCPARVVYATVDGESPLSLYRLYESGEAIFAALRGALERQPRSRRGRGRDSRLRTARRPPTGGRARRMRRMTGMALLILASAPATAEESPPMRISLAFAERLALSGSAELRLRELEVRAAERRYRLEARAWLPQLEVAFTSQARVDRFAPDSSGNELRLTLAQPLYNGGRTVAQRSLARLELVLGRRSVEATRAETRAKVRDQFYQLLALEAQLAVRQGYLCQGRRELAIARTEHEAGIARALDLLDSELQVSTLELERQKSEGSLAEAAFAFKRSLGLSPDREVSLDGALDPSYDGIQFDLAPSLLVRLAEEGNLELETARSRVTAAAAQAALARGRALPQVSASLALSLSGERLPLSSPGLAFGLAVSFPQPDAPGEAEVVQSATGGDSRSRNASLTLNPLQSLSGFADASDALLALERARAELADLRLTVRFQVAAGIADYRRRQEAARIERRSIELERRKREVMRMELERGLTTRVELLKEELLAADMESRHLDSVLALMRGEWAIERLIGVAPGELALVASRAAASPRASDLAGSLRTGPPDPTAGAPAATDPGAAAEPTSPRSTRRQRPERGRRKGGRPGPHPPRCTGADGLARLAPPAVCALLLAAGAALTACARPVLDATRPPPPSVRVRSVHAQPYTPTIESFGTLSYRSKTDVAASVEGLVAEIDVEEGDRVHQGDPLARLENPQLQIARSQAEAQVASAQAAVRLAEARLCEGRQQVEARLLALRRDELQIEQRRLEAEEAERSYRKREELRTVDGISEEELASLRLRASSARAAHEALLRQRAVDSVGLRDEDLAAAGFRSAADPQERSSLLIELNTRTLKAQLEAANAAVTSAQSNLAAASALVEALTLRSPVAGTIGSRAAGVGERVAPGDPLLTLVDDGELYAVFPVAERAAASLARGMAVEVSVPAIGDRRYDSSLSIISPLLDPASGNLTVRARIANGEGTLRPGLFIRARVRTGGSRQVIAVPSTALVRRRAEQATIFVAREGRSFERAVLLETGEEEPGGVVRIANGIAEGELIIDEPPPALRNGGEVHVETE